MTAITKETRDAFAGIAAGRAEVLEQTLELHDTAFEAKGLDGRTFSLVKLAILIALDAPPASYAWQVASAIESGATADDMLGVMRAVAPQVGSPRVVAAAPEIMLALGLSLPEGSGRVA
jgi:alkylhydroperoxidase/carboxymuconolactone decarboxylase family protein YurZ